MLDGHQLIFSTNLILIIVQTEQQVDCFYSPPIQPTPTTIANTLLIGVTEQQTQRLLEQI